MTELRQATEAEREALRDARRRLRRALRREIAEEGLPATIAVALAAHVIGEVMALARPDDVSPGLMRDAVLKNIDAGEADALGAVRDMEGERRPDA